MSTLAPKLWTVDEVAEYLRVSRKTAEGYVRQGQIPSVKIGGRRLIPEDLLKVGIPLKLSARSGESERSFRSL